MVKRLKVFSFISSRQHFKRSSATRISDSSQTGFELAQKLSIYKPESKKTHIQ